ncbi:carbamate kinase [Jutongia hominis]|uniref:Carbamate kinase n=1 Tax=Jutongia hominis TaxID=2763664 RepID=A0ABR7MSE1_9FIRM|nr:carbamate kinase [Jutongia hominis]MBC8556727.1 carbamate kinase [Jutongia hominis]
MNTKRIVVALGHSALGKTFPEQKENVKKAANAIADLVEAKYEIVITHSNGPQIGMIHSAMTEYSRLEPSNTVAPMSICSAMSQGYIGYDLQNEIRTELLNRGIYKPVSTLITQVRVDPFDAAFTHPDKVIGRYMTEEEAKAEEKKGNHVIKTEGKGYRRIIASPRPMEIYELDAIKALMDAQQIVIAAGGGGIPVLQQGTRLKGASAVIEKDITSACLAEQLDADVLLLLTEVEKVALNYGSPSETPLDSMTVEEATGYIDEKQFSSGAMLPKVEAAVSFASSNKDRKAIITSIDTALAGLTGKTGTLITC